MNVVADSESLSPEKPSSRACVITVREKRCARRFLGMSQQLVAYERENARREKKIRISDESWHFSAPWGGWNSL